MRDREVINRYCAFSLAKGIGKEYLGDMDDFLARTLGKMNKMKPDELINMSSVFRKSMVNNYLVFERHAFRRHMSKDEPRSVINVALFDVFSVLMARFETDFVNTHTEEMWQRYYLLMSDENFVSSISTSINSLSTNSVTKVRDRFALVEKAFKDM